MARRPKLTDEQRGLKERVKAAYAKPSGFRYHHRDWDKKLWSRPYEEITEFLEDRFRTTLNEVEYYGCMMYLYHAMPDSELLVEFGDAPQVVFVRETYNNDIDQNKTFAHVRSRSPEDDISMHTVLESVNTVEFVGAV